MVRAVSRKQPPSSCPVADIGCIQPDYFGVHQLAGLVSHLPQCHLDRENSLKRVGGVGKRAQAVLNPDSMR